MPAFINYNLAGKPLTHSVKTSTSRLLLVDEDVRGAFPPEQLDAFAAQDFRDGGGSVDVIFFTPDVEAQIMLMDPVRAGDEVRAGVIRRDMSILIYTSGTTGLPKAAIVSWNKCWAGGTFTSVWMGIKQTDRYFSVGFSLTCSGSTAADSLIVHASLPFFGRASGLPY